MKYLFSIFTLLLVCSVASSAGTVSGTVKSNGPSAVVLEPVPAKTFPAPTQTASIDQRGMKFVPALLVIQQGTTVEFRNSDSVAHNVFWPSISGNKKMAHNLGTASNGQVLRFKFDNPGNVPLFCNVHPEMSGNIVVNVSPYFAQSDASGAYSIANVPDGDYKATAWHNGKSTVMNISVKGDTKADFTSGVK